MSILNDHDHVFGEKLRFSTRIPDNSIAKDHQVVVPTAIQLFTLGIPCLYYGTEQAMAGAPESQRQYLPSFGSSDRYLRETMFGNDHPRAIHTHDLQDQVNNVDGSLPAFSAFGITGKHVFDTTSPAYVRIAALAHVRSRYLTLRAGRQYYRRIKTFGDFVDPGPGELIAWSRILDREEVVCVINPNGEDTANRGGDVIVSSELWSGGGKFQVVANTAESWSTSTGTNFTGTHAIGSIINTQTTQSGTTYISVREILPCEVVVFVSVS